MKKLIRIFCDGSGGSPYGGSPSGLAWIREDTRERHIERVAGLTNNMAEYRAVLSALKSIRGSSRVEILTDSLLVVSQLRGDFRIKDPRLAKLAAEVKTLAARKRLDLKITWVPRSQNKAGKLI